MRRINTLLGVGLLSAVLLASGCKIDPYNTGTNGNWPPIPDASLVDAGPQDGGDAETCEPAAEVCDGTDNDCDGVVDNVGPAVVASDPFNCGSCGNACTFPSASATCIGGACELASCNPNYWDLNNDDSDGCEYQCFERNNGVEVCNGFDDDCDGDTDEDFDLQNDPNNCGACYAACAFFQGEGSCVAGQCELSNCRGGYVDKDGNPNNGCECLMGVTESVTTCDATNPCGTGEVCADVDNDGVSHCGTIPQDVCDGVDNDCDGTVDEDAPAELGTAPCYTHPVGCTEDASNNWTCVGTCQTGIPTCVGGGVVCGAQVAPSAEVCDNLDNDCNGTVDDGYDKLNDPANCGSCGNQCVLANAVPACVTGACVVSGCMPNWWNLNGTDSDGCEYNCTISNSGVEACGDSVDNDCDGQVDEGFDYQSDANNCGTCGYNCTTVKPFGTQVTGCSSGACQFTCQADYYDLNGDLAQGENGNGCEYFCVQTGGGTETCDGVDNDCNGVVDDGFNLNTDVANCGGCGNACASSAGANSQVDSCTNGVCRYSCLTGYVDLDGDVSLGGTGNGCEYTCSVTNSGDEACDGVDNDCDGDTDEAPGGGVLTQACYTGASGTENVGPCHGGTQTCTGGAYGACQGEVVPGVETCDGVDNDCDASVDEDGGGAPLTQACYTGPVGTENVGPCTGGTQTCTGGAFGACAGQVTPALEVCDSADNDCDGSADEDFDTTTDMGNCGGCGVSCVSTAGADSYPTSCTAGVCYYACSPNHYDIDGDVASGSAGTGCEYGCVLSNNGVEACGDGVDNDCDNEIDEGFDLQNDPNNCNACGYACAAHEGPNSTQTGCTAGVCQFACDTGFYDLNSDVGSGDAGNGCEYACTPTGAETCDGADNDCDGDVDETFNLQTDAANCGSCGYACAGHAGANSTATGCVAGACQFVCDTGFIDLNGNIGAGDNGDGCEYSCTPTGAETCDGVDNDCNGVTDDDGAGQPLSQVCYTPGYGATTGCTAQGTCVGTCQEGTQTCSGGTFGVCAGEINPQTELCDGADNDCDGSSDEDFNVNTDINNCGGCGQSCWSSAPDDSYPIDCVGGSCQFTCKTGFNDLNGDLNLPSSDGCEYTCPVNPPVAEFCDGVDNDCDGVPDNGVTAPVGYCYQGIDGPGTPGTAGNNPCKGVTAVCQDPDGGGPLAHTWWCQWPASVETSPTNPNALLGYETLCNGWDGDCDGVADEDYALKGTTCDDAGIGACRGTGSYICNGTEDGVVCDITDPGDSPGTEECNGIDDDCDGVVDNDTPGDMVNIVGGGLDFWIDVYEASRPDATALGSGSDGARACSEEARVPWSNVSWSEAEAACVAQGKRLCTEAEWQLSCEGPSGYAYPYGDVYDPEACNGRAYDHDCTWPNENYVLATGTPYGCPAPAVTDCEGEYSTIDMSGNLMEWTSTDVGSATPMYRVRGGSFDNIGAGMTCQFSFISAESEFRYGDLGFRCCSDTFPP